VTSSAEYEKKTHKENNESGPGEGVITAQVASCKYYVRPGGEPSGVKSQVISTEEMAIGH